MLMFDKYAYINPMKEQHPVEKIFFSIGSLVTVISVQSNWISLVVFLVMSAVLLLKAKIPPGFYGKILMLPFIFLLMSMIAILIEFSAITPVNTVISISWPYGTIFITPFGLERATALFLTSFSATSCLYFLILTTPLDELMVVAKKCKVPVILIELFAYIYRFIFLMLGISQQIHVAQQARLGHGTWRMRFNSFAMLLSSLLTQMLQQSTQYYHASLVKNDDDMFRTLALSKNYSPVFWILFFGYIGCLVCLVMFTN